MALNIFRYLSVESFPYDESSFRTLLKNKINENIEFIENEATEGQKFNAFSRAGVADEEELIDALNDVLEKLNDGSFIKQQADEEFNSLYGKFLNKFISLVDNGAVYQKEYDELLKEVKLDPKRAEKVLNYKKGDLPEYKFQKERIVVKKEEFELIPQNDYDMIKSFFIGEKEATFDSLKKHFDNANIASAEVLLDAITKKVAKTDDKLDASSISVLYSTLKKYANDADIKRFVDSLYIYDLTPILQRKWNEAKEDKQIGAEELEAFYQLGMNAGFKPTNVSLYLKYFSKKEDVHLYLPSNITTVGDQQYTCPFCGQKYYKVLPICPTCHLSLVNAGYEVEKIRKFTSLSGNHRILKRRYNEMLESIESIRKYASKDVHDYIKQASEHVRKSRKSHWKAVLITLSVATVLLGSAAFVYFLSVRKFENEYQSQIYHIKNREDFEKINTHRYLNDTYILDTDISFFGDEIDPVGSLEKPFTGRFIGNGHVISNFKIKNANENMPTALFIRNEGFIDRLGIDGITSESKFYASSMVHLNKGVISNSYVKNSNVLVNGDYGVSSGFCTFNEGEISYTYSHLTKMASEKNYSGFVYHNTSEAVVKDSFVSIDLIDTGENLSLYHARFVFANDGEVKNVYSTITSSATYSVDYDNVEIKDTTKEEAQTLDFYNENLGWSTNIWNIIEGYSTLKEEE